MGEARLSVPANGDVTWSMRNTAKVLPRSRMLNFARSLTSYL
jgi:hypothetical protein